MRMAIAICLVLAPIFFALGITLPLLTFEKLYFFEENPSLVGMVGTLFDNGDYALALVIALFSIAFPLAKMVAVMLEAVTPTAGEGGWIASLIPLLGKWSLMDVMLVAIVIAAAKTSGLANAFSEPGLWFYAGATLMISLAQALIARARRQAA